MATGSEYARNDDPSFVVRYSARCHCGAVRYEVNADPLDAKYCHCEECQTLHGAPFQWAAIFAKENIRFVSGVEHLRFYSAGRRQMMAPEQRELPCKVSCGMCGTPLADEGRRMWLAFPEIFRFDGRVPQAFKATCHIFYGSRSVDVDDALPKWQGHKNRSPAI